MTELELERLYKAETGNRKGFSLNAYYQWCEQKLIEMMNDEKKVKELFDGE